jgi:formylglycine-generating enzyme required for sulfatase activity
VTIGAPFAMSATEITVRQFRYFVKDHDYHKAAKAKNNKYPVRNNGEYDMSAICGTFEEGMLEPDRKDRSWKNPGFDQTDSDPVVCVSWQDANAFTDWLSSKTNLSYSLPTEAEWEYAARGGTNSKQDADNPKLACEYGNVMDKAGKVLIPKDKINNWVAHECDDHFKFTAPTGSFKPNRLGFYDMIGNVWEWVKDSYHPNYNGAPDKGGEWNEGGSKYRVLRGGSWSDDANGSRVAARGKGLETMHNFTVGFRVVRACPNNSCNQ